MDASPTASRLSPARLSPEGMSFATGCYLLWGIVPIYWKAVAAVPAHEMLLARILWTLLFVGTIALATGRRREILGSPPGAWGWTFAAASVISINWVTFIYAVQTDRVLATSLGYFINPLMSVLFGMLVLGERLSRVQGISVLVAAGGVAAMAIRAGSVPWISLVLATSFALYGLVHKLHPQPAIGGLVREMAVLSPIAFVALSLLARAGDSTLAEAPRALHALVALAGPVTAAPLLLFHAAARRLPLVVVGMFQYIAPTFTFLLATLWYREPFTRDAAIGFALVWVALGLFVFDATRRLRRLAIG
ncbi:MAG: EamA family transporter RarD [Myxococcota bacterium]